eukprot:CAMPEP_0168772782 /NCGR_PEP_ID=MMETSP0725-20121227/4133_1 /TAXON_ID=265536 /ORGANISM="Amphiprora sp., Strain CCMP467" /LENGTH=536 /DNA_ID=CAMNT_0008822309 /DNA_START=26 /DNA_END=1634 /DNA_ORIENTATION=-
MADENYHDDEGYDHDEYDADEGLIDNAYVADHGEVVTDVTIILTDEEEKLIEGEKQRRFFFGMVCCFLIVVAIIVPVAITQSGGSSGSTTPPPTDAPTEQPSTAPSGAPTTDELSDTIECLQSITSFDTFQDRQGGQFKAVDWIVNEDAYAATEGMTCEEQRFIIRYAMATTFFAMGGEQWAACGISDPDCDFGNEDTGWLSSSSVCDWYRVRCDNDGEVVALNFGSLLPQRRSLVPLGGDFPTEFGTLTMLQQLQFKDFGVTSIPSFFTQFSNLEELNLENNQVRGSFFPFSGEAFPSLRTLVLTNNFLTGPIPTVHGTLSTIREYRAGQNGLTGQVPEELANMSLVAHFDLGDNDLEGNVTDALFDLLELRILSLHTNDLIGSIPAKVGNLVFLERIFLNSTLYGGEIPNELYTLPKLQEIKLRSARFTGSIDPSIQNLTSLQVFDISQNSGIGGTIPDVFGDIPFLEELRLDQTELTGELSASVCEATGDDFGEIEILVVDCFIETPRGFPDAVTASQGKAVNADGFCLNSCE